MDKVHTYSKKIVIAAAIIAAVGSICAPKGALAASWLDPVLIDNNSWADVVIETTNAAINPRPATNIYGDYTLALSHFATNSSAGAQKTCATDAYNHWNTSKYLINFDETLSKRHLNSWNSGDANIAWHFGTGARSGTFSQTMGGTSGYSATTTYSGNSWPYRIEYSIAGGSGGGVYMESSVNPGVYIGVQCYTNATVNTAGSLLPYNRSPLNLTGLQPIFARGINWTYPSGYVGPNFRDNYSPPIPPLTDTPNIILRGVNNWRGEFSDENFFTFDEVPFTCEGGLAPVISGEVWDERGSPVLMDTFEANATGLFNITFPVDTDDSDYRIVAWYICDDDVNFFSDSSHYSFTITGYGQLKNEDLFAACVDADFPFLHFEDCLENMFTVINMLKFGNANFGGNWSSPEGCYTLTYIDDWINRPGQIVCPAVKGTVRALMTPVVLFLLALAMVRVINRYNERRP